MKNWKQTPALLALILILNPVVAFTQMAKTNQVNLDDVKIQGESNRNKNLFANRNRFDLEGRVKLRQDFRDAVLESKSSGASRLPASLVEATPYVPPSN